MSEDNKLFGHCYCGAVALEISGRPVKVAHCHCESCRRHSGAAMLTSAGFKLEQIQYTAKQPTNFKTKDAVTRSFCNRCGSSISYKREESDFVFVYVGIFNEPEKLKPQVHMMKSEKIAWLRIDEHLPWSDELA